jgi:hypothetical protein
LWVAKALSHRLNRIIDLHDMVRLQPAGKEVREETVFVQDFRLSGLPVPRPRHCGTGLDRMVAG